MITHYGYADGSGEYYIVIDTGKCDGCGACIEACPMGIFEMIIDDYDKSVACVKEEVRKSLHHICPGYYQNCANEMTNCHKVCSRQAIAHTW